MRTQHLKLIGFIVTALIFPLAAAAQNSTFSDPNVEYTFALPDQKWKMTSKPSATSPNVEFVYSDRLDGHFDVRKISPEKDASLSDVIREEENKLQFMQGFVAGKEEKFAGRLDGTVFNFEFVRSGRAMSGRYYFLRSGDLVYLLRFTGFRDKLRVIRNQTDSIARTFGIKEGE